MRAVVHDRYGSPDVLRIQDVDRPVPLKNEVLIKIHASTVTRTDCAIRQAKPFMWRYFAGVLRPRRKILGIELAGEVAEVGATVTQFKVGDHVFGINWGNFGAHAEYICMRESAALAHMPITMTFEEAAAVCDGAIQALASLTLAGVCAGQKVLIYGASGSCGTAAVQLAKNFEARVTAVCSTKNVELVKSLGADEVIDYLQDDFTRNGETYDVILDAVDKQSFLRCRGSLKQGGVYIATDLGRFMVESLILILWTSRIGNKRLKMGMPRFTKTNVLLIKGLIEAGKYRAVIDRCYPLEGVVEATKYVETEQKTGNVVLIISGDRRKDVSA
ncbi:MAG: NAD(P)-dependent alcohol dehydrogenase [Ilumatobacteraceae bacterium]